MISCIISGGQSGADLGGLKAAIKLGISTSGYMPRGWKTENGPKPEYGDIFGMIEHEFSDYPSRTEDNIKLAQGTVIFGKRSPGSNLTEELCRKLGKPCCWIGIVDKEAEMTEGENGTIHLSDIADFRAWIRSCNISILNCAGNRESRNPGIAKFTEEFLVKALK